MKPGPIPQFVKELGHQVVAYFLNIDEHEADALLRGKFELDGDRQKVFLEFVEKCRQIRAAQSESNDPQFQLVSRLSLYIKDGQHVFSIIRRDLGGVQPEIDEGDNLVRLVGVLAANVYPILLLHISAPFPPFLSAFTRWPTSGPVADSHQQLLNAIIEDKAVGKIFRSKDGTARQDSVEFATSTGRSSSLQLDGFPELIVLKAFEFCRLRNDYSIDGLLKSVSTVIGHFRDLAEGKAIEIPVHIGFHNIGVIGNMELNTGLGVLRAYHAGIYSLLSPDARPSTLGGTNEVLGFILESSTKYRVFFHKNLNDIGTKEFERTFASLKELEEQFSLAVALAIDRTPPIGLTSAWTHIFDPISLGANLSRKFVTFSPFNHYLLDEQGGALLITWCERIKTHQSKYLNIAIHRVVSCISDRLDPVDGFIDAVMAWENMFGNGPELKFRISMAIAKLLEENVDARVRLQKAVSTLYDRRSEIVHGSKTVSHETAAVMRNEAVTIALRCLRVLYTSRTELINQKDRAKQILLQ